MVTTIFKMNEKKHLLKSSQHFLYNIFAVTSVIIRGKWVAKRKGTTATEIERKDRNILVTLPPPRRKT